MSFKGDLEVRPLFLFFSYDTAKKMYVFRLKPVHVMTAERIQQRKNKKNNHKNIKLTVQRESRIKIKRRNATFILLLRHFIHCRARQTTIGYYRHYRSYETICNTLVVQW